MQRTTAVLYSTAVCSLNCTYCYINKNKGLPVPPHGVGGEREILEGELQVVGGKLPGLWV